MIQPERMLSMVRVVAGMPNFLSLLRKLEVLVGFLNYSVGMGGPGQVVGDLDI